MDTGEPPADELLQALRGLSVGVAVASPSDWRIAFENARFFQWFPPRADGEALAARLPGFDPVRARLTEGRPYGFEVETSGDRRIPIEVEMRPLGKEDAGSVLVECRDLSKQKQAEYMLESYSQMAELHTRDLQREKDRVEKLLLNIMPKSVYEEMKEYGTVTPQRFARASVLMLDFVGFTEMAVSREPGTLVAELNDIFTAFDRIVELFGCERIKTIGDAYMAVSGLPEATPDHARNIARAALRMRRYIERRNTAHPEPWSCRIGIDSGQVVGSVVGVEKYVYDIFGPAVNRASRLESLSEPMQITVSEETFSLIRSDFACVDRGEFEVKGFGTLRLFALDREMGQGR